jgi:hypothetical protein
MAKGRFELVRDAKRQLAGALFWARCISRSSYNDAPPFFSDVAQP